MLSFFKCACFPLNASLICVDRNTGGKSYYISFVYQDPSTIKKTKPRGKKKTAAVAAAAAAANDDDDVADDDEVLHEPPTKKAKSSADDVDGVKGDDVEAPVVAAPVNRTGPFNFQGKKTVWESQHESRQTNVANFQSHTPFTLRHIVLSQ